MSFCPWLALAGFLDGVAAYERGDFDPDEYGTHPLCTGFLTSAAEQRALVFKMMEVINPAPVDRHPQRPRQAG